VAVLAAVGIAGPSHAATLVYGGGTETGSRFNPGGGVIDYMNCFTAIDGTGLQTQLVLDSAIVGIRRISSAGALTDVGINISAAEMTYDGASYGLGASYPIYSSASLGAGAASVTQRVDTGLVSGVTLNLETVSNVGFGGFWIGVEFTGANAANVANGWRVVNAPTTGTSINGFGMFNYQASGAFQAFYTLGASPTPSRFMVDVNGTLVPEPSTYALLLLSGAASLWASKRRKS